jgi:putative peptidoglycan lipid II flippase
MITQGVTISFIFGLSTLIQFVSQIVITRIFGAATGVEIFLAAVTIPSILVTVVYGTLNDAFVPLYGSRKHEKNANAYFSSMLTFVTVVSVVVTFILIQFAPLISSYLYGSRGEGFAAEVGEMMKYLLLVVPLSVVATIFGSHYYAHKKLLRFPLAQMVGSVSNLFVIMANASKLGIFALVAGFIINILVQIPLVITRFQFTTRIPWKETGALLAVWLPLIIGTLALRMDTLLIRAFGADLPEGYIVYLNLISRIFMLATGIMTIGLQILLLPNLVDYIQKRNYQRASDLVDRAKIVAVTISVMTTFALMLLIPFVITYFFVGGKFSPEDARITISLTPYFFLAGVGWGSNAVFFHPLLALKKHTEVGMLNVAALILAWFVSNAVQSSAGTLPAISAGLIILLFTGIIGSEILWQKHKRELLRTSR